jgi:exopolysaccharide biosynthesis WecB/TagA/CpsF family protein
MRNVTAFSPASHELFGVNVLSCKPDEACDLIESRILLGAPTRIAFLNANLSLLAIQRVGLREMLGEFLIFNDGVGIDIANRMLNGSTFVANLNGSDFIPYFLTRVRTSLRIFLLGATPATLEKVARNVQSRWPRHTIAGQAPGFIKPDQENAIAEMIVRSRSHLVLVAMGNPTQELWIGEYIPRCAPCAFGVGGLFDFMAGNVKRAPDSIRALRLEWLFRLSQEPRRLWQRYLIGNAKFLTHVLALRLRRSASHMRLRRSS